MSSKFLSLVVAAAFILSLGAMARSPATASTPHRSTLSAATAAPIVVNDLDDTTSTCVITCTLRAAITIANSNPGTDTITFLTSGTITLTSSLPTIDDIVTIDGIGQAITVSGANQHQVMVVNISQTLNLNALTIVNGECTNCDGGGIVNHGTLTVSNSTFSDNSADNGGGIYSAGTLMVTNSAFSINRAYAVAAGGGGIYNVGTAAVTNSTFSGNRTYGTFGGGAGIYNGGTVTVTNSTIAGNFVYFDSFLSGGIHNAGTATLYNTILANNSDNYNCSGTVTNAGHNLDSGIACGWGTSDGSLSNTNPHLGPLAGNGGSTPTMALLPGGPAIDAGDDGGCPATDQRGVARPIGSHCDIGAYEALIHSTYLPAVTK
jgi:hypothetical protein